MTTHQASPTPTLLDYGRTPSKGRVWLRRGILITLLLVAGIASYRWGPATWRRLLALYAQRQCLNFQLPADCVLYEEEPGAAAKLRASNPQFTSYPLNRIVDPTPTVSSPQKPKQMAAAYMPSCWTRFNAAWHVPIAVQAGVPAGAVIFVHERVSPAGHRRLVCVRYFPDQPTFCPSFIAGFNYEAASITPAGLTGLPKFAMRSYAIDVISGFPRHPPNVRMYAGQIDPTDPAHFTIRYEMWGETDVLDGCLLDNDDVTLTPRHSLIDRE